jgi:Na+/H+ antiporter NhaC
MKKILSLFFQILLPFTFLFSPVLAQDIEEDSLNTQSTIQEIETDFASLIQISPEKKLLRKGHDLTLNFSTEKPEAFSSIHTVLNFNGKEFPFSLEEGESSLSIPSEHVKENNEVSINGQAHDKIDLALVDYAPWLSLIPPLLAIFMALLFKEVISSLFAGIFLGAAIIAVSASGSIKDIFTAFLTSLDTYIVDSLVSEDHISIILFSLLIGGMVAIISKNGGMLGIVNRISRIAKTPKSGQFATWLLGVSIFFDDYANSLVVGNTMRSITDKLRISREKLSYIVDSTAAPVSALAFISTWIAAELSYIEDGMVHLVGMPEGLSPYRVFLMSLPYSFYPILTLAFILFLIFTGKDFGPMLKAEQRTRKTGAVNREGTAAAANEDLSHFTPIDGVVPKAYNAVIPVLVLVIGVLIGLVYTGWDAEVWNNPELNFGAKLSQIIGNSDSYSALMWASLTGLLVSIVMTLFQGKLALVKIMDVMGGGFKAMMGAMIILTLAWALQGITTDIHTADFLTDLVGTKISPYWFPVITFILGALVSFSTGSSWGAMAILYPLVIPLAWKVSLSAGLPMDEVLPIFANVVASVLAGSVLGDHCSPISDTTILSSLACDCDHIDHVRTQLPYALVVGVVSILLGIIPVSFGIPNWICFLISLGALWALIRFYGRYTSEIPAE